MAKVKQFVAIREIQKTSSDSFQARFGASGQKIGTYRWDS